MKTIRTLLIAITVMVFGSTQAQVSVGLNVNIGAPPAWAPPPPVHTEVRYYYLPEIQTYYDCNTRHYIYMDNGRWARRAYLPVAYRGYNLYRGPKVIVNNYYGPTPYTHYRPARVAYARPVKHKHYKHHDHHDDHRHHDDHGRGRGHGRH
ncbi:MAG: hypothetical protein DI539_02005 [Flavobacterium psychrophilum]|nr:MAG: hypothetical protein DI539_02005 [Flavobacterium psychrophilum]